MTTSLPFSLENELERRLVADPQWQQGAAWGKPRPGHPEGSVMAHIADVLDNIDKFQRDNPQLEKLRMIALVHDTFKYQVDCKRPRTGENHHAMRARRFAKAYIDDEAVLEVIELHDEAYNAWQKGHRDGNWDSAHQRAAALMERLGDTLDLYLAFYECDNATDGKQTDCFDWFRRLCDDHPRDS